MADRVCTLFLRSDLPAIDIVIEKDMVRDSYLGLTIVSHSFMARRIRIPPRRNKTNAVVPNQNAGKFSGGPIDKAHATDQDHICRLAAEGFRQP